MNKLVLATTAILLATSLYTGKAKAADCVDDNGVAGKSCTFITVDGTEKLFSITYNDNTSTRYSYNGSVPDVYTYNSNGKMTSSAYYSNGNKTPSSETKYTYDENGNKIGYTENGTKCVCSNNTCTQGTYASIYTSDGNIAKKVSYDSEGNVTGTETSAKIFTAEQAYAATSKGNNNSFSIRFK